MKDETKLVTAGRDPEGNFGIVNVPVYHASTILYPSLDALQKTHAARAAGERVVSYGRIGTPTTWSLEDAVADLEGGYRAQVFPSGLAACANAILAVVKTGDHMLVTDSVYGPVRVFCDNFLSRFGVEVTYYDPLVGAGIGELMRPNTTAVYTEAPGSQTFEMQDIPAIADVAHAKGAVVLTDNTWASPLFFKPFEHGVDISIQAGTKYIVGHSDVMIGTVTANKEYWPQLQKSANMLGQTAGPDDVYLAQRGIRTLSVRLNQHMENALQVAEWLKGRPEVHSVLHPAMPDDPGHAIWKRDFLGASGLFSIRLKEVPKAALAAFLDDLELFGMGYSWGGYESLVILADPTSYRTATTWDNTNPLLRLHIGLEAVDDLIADLKSGFDRLNAAK
ncbi:cystathionine beta-lyase [Sneathiella sp. CAU 1612]|uniref:Cystathionine beta-lyase n=1 Tax=Sneathiella sedimenti TaxID=2816034 RepID=A0ABS3F7S0_9PROT|nr:cystathionine beta-lyase [Sneathiella sedimenti]MBO0334555.1 cystathionine beta-lyase [Sneathiella sedimenti]